jgi:hypothetical protein
MNDIHNETYNPIFEVINNIDTRRHHTQYKTLNHTTQRTVTSTKYTLKTHHNIIYVQFQVANNILYTLQADTKNKGTNEHD